MRKLYKRDPGGTLLYHEAWVHAEHVVAHFGQVGDRGETREHKTDTKLSEDENVNRILQPAINEGFQELNPEKSCLLVIEYAIEGKVGTVKDLDKRHELEHRLNEMLGWTGLGHCDGGSIGSGTMEVFCPVVEFDIARKVIENALIDKKFSDYTRIYDSSDI